MDSVALMGELIDEKPRPSGWPPHDTSIGGDPPARHSMGSDIVVLILVGFAYFALANLGLRLASINPSATPIWPPTGLAIAAVLLWGYRIAPAIFIGALLINQLTAGSIFTSIAIACGNTFEAVIAGYLIRHRAEGEQIFDTPSGVAKFALISLVVTVVSATIGVSSLTLAGYAEVSSFISVWLTWWLGNLAGALVVAPVVVLWAKSEAASFTPPQITRTGLTYLAAVAVGVMAFSPVLQQTPARDALGFFVVLPLLWASLRRGPRDTATVALIISAFAVWGTLMHGGPFAKPSLNDSFILLLAFMVSAAVLSLALSTDVKVIHRIEDERLKLAHDLHDGILQNLTAATLQLKVCSRNCDAVTRHNLKSIQELLAAEQKRIRDFVSGGRQKNDNEDFLLTTACERVLRELSAYWRCQTSLRVVPGDAHVPSAIAEQLWLILAEGIANAAKHGGASHVLVDLERTTESLFVCISDNGSGFQGLAGTYTDETLIAQHLGPRFLCDRVRGLRGSLMLSTSPAGARLQIRLPGSIS